MLSTYREQTSLHEKVKTETSLQTSPQCVGVARFVSGKGHWKKAGLTCLPGTSDVGGYYTHCTYCYVYINLYVRHKTHTHKLTFVSSPPTRSLWQKLLLSKNQLAGSWKGMNLPSTSTQIATDLSDSCACVPLATLSTEEDVDNVRLSPRQCWTRKTWLTFVFGQKFNMCDFPPGPDRHQFNNPGVYLSQNIFRKAARCEVTWPETVVMVPNFNSNRPTTQT